MNNQLQYHKNNMNHYFPISNYNSFNHITLKGKSTQNTLMNQFPYIYAFPPFFPSLPHNGSIRSETIPIKTEDDINIEVISNQVRSPQKKSSKKRLKKKIKKQAIHENKNTSNILKYYPLQPSSRKVYYFDPTVAPNLTSQAYNLISKQFKDHQNQQAIKQNQNILSEIKFRQRDTSSFIIFRHRKCKKKYKKILSTFNKEILSDFINSDSELQEDQMSQRCQYEQKMEQVIQNSYQDDSQGQDHNIVDNKSDQIKVKMYNNDQIDKNEARKTLIQQKNIQKL